MCTDYIPSRDDFLEILTPYLDTFLENTLQTHLNDPEPDFKTGIASMVEFLFGSRLNPDQSIQQIYAEICWMQNHFLQAEFTDIVNLLAPFIPNMDPQILERMSNESREDQIRFFCEIIESLFKITFQIQPTFIQLHRWLRNRVSHRPSFQETIERRYARPEPSYNRDLYSSELHRQGIGQRLKEGRSYINEFPHELSSTDQEQFHEPIDQPPVDPEDDIFTVSSREPEIIVADPPIEHAEEFIEEMIQLAAENAQKSTVFQEKMNVRRQEIPRMSLETKKRMKAAAEQRVIKIKKQLERETNWFEKKLRVIEKMQLRIQNLMDKESREQRTEKQINHRRNLQAKLEKEIGVHHRRAARMTSKTESMEEDMRRIADWRRQIEDLSFHF